MENESPRLIAKKLEVFNKICSLDEIVRKNFSADLEYETKRVFAQVN